MNKLIRILIGALLTWSAVASAASERQPDLDHVDDRRSTRTVVLVHGAFADGSSWTPVIRILQARGFRVVAVQNPLTSLAAGVDAVNRSVNQINEPVILVGHSWGGVVITEAGNNAHVKALVYVAAFAPDAGQSINLLLAGLPAAPWLAELRQDEGHYLTLSADGMSRFFAPDLPAQDVAVMTATQGPWFAGCLGDTVTTAAWRAKRAWWVLPELDQIIDPHLQHAMAARINAKVITARSGHTVMVSHAETVAKVIAAAARAN